MEERFEVVVLISANAEWEAIREIFADDELFPSPFGEWLIVRQLTSTPIVFFHGGWGKIAAAASTQYAIDRWQPLLLVNLGTCGGFEGEVERGEIVLVERTLVYDIYEQMEQPEDYLAYYVTPIDLSWLARPYPHAVRRTLIVSGDRDLLPQEINDLKERYAAVVGDWESGAIAWVAARNQRRVLILRGVSDLVGYRGGEVYGDMERFKQSARWIIQRLVEALPAWLRCAGIGYNRVDRAGNQDSPGPVLAL